MPETLIVVQASDGLSVVPGRFSTDFKEVGGTAAQLARECLGGLDDNSDFKTLHLASREPTQDHLVIARALRDRGYDQLIRATAGTPLLSQAAIKQLAAHTSYADRVTFKNIGVTMGLERVKASSYLALVRWITEAEQAGVYCEHLKAHAGLPGMYLAPAARREKGLWPDAAVRGGLADRFTNEAVDYTVDGEPLSGLDGINLHISGLKEATMEEDRNRVGRVAAHLGQCAWSGITPQSLASAYRELQLPENLPNDLQNPRFIGPQTSFNEAAQLLGSF